MTEENFNHPAASLPSLLTETAARHGEYVATTINEKDLSYGELNEQVNRFAHGLIALGVEPGDRVALVLPNLPTHVIAAYAVLKIGGVVVSHNLLLGPEELGKRLVSTDARVLVTFDRILQKVLAAARKAEVETVVVASTVPAAEGKGPSLPPAAVQLRWFDDIVAASPDGEPGVVVASHDLAVLQYTSGSTDAPKAIALSHGNIVSNVLQIEHAMAHEDFGNGAVICLLPFFHVFGLTTCLHLPVYRGYRMIFVPGMGWPSGLMLLELIEKYHPVSFPAVPPLWAALVSQSDAGKAALSTIRIPSAGGAPLPWRVQERFHALTGRWISLGYGLSEASSTTHMSPLQAEPKRGSIGLPLPGTEARIVDVETGTRDCAVGEAGELVIKGPQVMTGYWRNQSLTNEVLRNGWLHTGDVARKDEEGFYYIVDRMDDLIISKGYNVYPAEVEAVLVGHSSVEEVAVVGIPDPIRGQVVTAVVVAAEGSPTHSADLIAWCRKELPDYKVPVAIHFTKELPKNRAGEVMRRVLRDKGLEMAEARSTSLDSL